MVKGWGERGRTAYITYNHSHFQIHTCVHRPSVETGNSGWLQGADQGGWVLGGGKLTFYYTQFLYFLNCISPV